MFKEAYILYITEVITTALCNSCLPNAMANTWRFSSLCFRLWSCFSSLPFLDCSPSHCVQSKLKS